MCKITVALSVYNVEQYLKDSIDCILRQTFSDFELLCIDDASTDSTWDILQEYQRRDSRMRLIRQDRNKGLSVSRNLAIQEARGDYLLMLDGDDLYAEDMLEKAYGKAVDSNAEMVLWDYVAFRNEEEIQNRIKVPSELADINPNDKVKLLRRPAFSPVRMIKRSVLHSLNIQFPVGLTKQDIPVHWKLVTSLNNIALIPKYFLFYRQQPNNTTSRRDRSVFSLAYVMDITRRQLIEDGIYDSYKEEFIKKRLSLLQGMYDYVQPELKAEALSIVRERLGEEEKTYLDTPNNELTTRIRDFYAMIDGSHWSTIKYKGYNLLRSIYRFFE